MGRGCPHPAPSPVLAGGHSPLTGVLSANSWGPSLSFHPAPRTMDRPSCQPFTEPMPSASFSCPQRASPPSDSPRCSGFPVSPSTLGLPVPSQAAPGERPCPLHRAHFLPYLLGGNPKSLPLPHGHREVLVPSVPWGWRSSVPRLQRRARALPAARGPLPSWPECWRCSWRPHPNTRSFGLPFFFPLCRAFMAEPQGSGPATAVPQDLCPLPVPHGTPSQPLGLARPQGAGLPTRGGGWPGNG